MGGGRGSLFFSFFLPFLLLFSKKRYVIVKSLLGVLDLSFVIYCIF